MTRLELFTRLADCTSDLERQIWALQESQANTLQLETIMHRLDVLVDAVLALDDNPVTEEIE